MGVGAVVGDETAIGIVMFVVVEDIEVEDIEVEDIEVGIEVEKVAAVDQTQIVGKEKGRFDGWKKRESGLEKEAETEVEVEVEIEVE